MNVATQHKRNNNAIPRIPTRPWWLDYRQKKQRRHEPLTSEMVIRSSISQVLKEYVNNCSVSGVDRMCEPNISWLQRVSRVTIFGAMVTLLAYLFHQTWVGTLTSPLIVSTESSTYPIGEIDFPAVAICNVNRISKKALKEVAAMLYPVLAKQNETLEEVEMFCLQLGRLLDFSYEENVGKGNSFMELIVQEKYNATFLVDTMKKLAPSCNEMLMRCAWGAKETDCSQLFTTRRTARGHCCAFNYILDYDSAQSPRYTIGEAKRQHIAGFIQGLNVILDPLVDDYAYPINSFMGFDVLLYDPSHFADLSAGRIIHRMVEPDMGEFMIIKSIKQVASPEVRKYPLNIRKCRFRDELSQEFNTMYSYSACIVRCRIKAVQSLCKCTPYFLPTGKKNTICTLEDLKCLNKYKEKLMYLYPMDVDDFEGLELEKEDSLYCPDCLPDCEFTEHSTKSFKIPMHRLGTREFYTDEFFENLNLTHKCYLAIHHAVTDGMLDRLDAVAYWYEVLSNIGGFAGVILGLSVFSVVEIVFFLFFRLILTIRTNYIINK